MTIELDELRTKITQLSIDELLDLQVVINEQ